MIATRTPLRLSFVGGGSDRPSFYQEEPGAVVAAAISLSVYVAVNTPFDSRVLAHYRATEDVATADELRHDRMRACLRRAGIDRAIEITSMADVPGSTGLGSSSAFTVGLLHALQPGLRREDYARGACAVELDDCGAPIGRQDQYIAAYGGLNLYRFHAGDAVTVAPVRCDTDALSDHLLLLYTGQIRAEDAGRVLERQRQRREDVRALAALAAPFAAVLEGGNLAACGAMLDEAWQIKRTFVDDPQVEAWYTRAMRAGAWGGKLCGAGGGGFLAMLAPPEAHAAIVAATGLRHVPVRAGVPGTEVLWAAR